MINTTHITKNGICVNNMKKHVSIVFKILRNHIFVKNIFFIMIFFIKYIFIIKICTLSKHVYAKTYAKR
jgi:hypothetical protein